MNNLYLFFIIHGKNNQVGNNQVDIRYFFLYICMCYYVINWNGSFINFLLQCLKWDGHWLPGISPAQKQQVMLKLAWNAPKPQLAMVMWCFEPRFKAVFQDIKLLLLTLAPQGKVLLHVTQVKNQRENTECSEVEIKTLNPESKSPQNYEVICVAVFWLRGNKHLWAKSANILVIFVMGVAGHAFKSTLETILYCVVG